MKAWLKRNLTAIVQRILTLLGAKNDDVGLSVVNGASNVTYTQPTPTPSVEEEENDPEEE